MRFYYLSCTLCTTPKHLRGGFTALTLKTIPVSLYQDHTPAKTNCTCCTVTWHDAGSHFKKKENVLPYVSIQ